MGGDKSNTKVIELKIPKGMKLLTIYSFNIFFKSSLQIDDHLDKLIKNIFIDENADIICLQNIYEKDLFKIIINKFLEFTKIKKKKKFDLHFSPNLTSLETTKTILSSTLNENDKLFTKNLLISKFPILSYRMEKLNENNYYSSVNISNIQVNNQIISILNCNLVNNIDNLSIDNSKRRFYQINKIQKYINENHIMIKQRHPDLIFKENVFLTGNFNIDEVDKNNEITEEFQYLISTLKCIDLFRLKNEQIDAFTNVFKERYDYIFFILSNDIFEENSKYLEYINENKINKLLYERYKFYPKEIKLIDNLKLNNKYPLVFSLIINVKS